MMSKLMRAALATLAAAGLAACNTTTATPFPVPAGPNPPPPPGYRVECTSTPGVAYDTFHNFHTGCRQIFAPERSQVVIRAKG